MRVKFPDFGTVDRSTWLEKIESELRGKSQSDLKWIVNDRIIQDPLLSQHDASWVSIDVPKQWKFGEFFEVHEAITDNKRIIEALEQGINAPHLHLLGLLNLDDLFQGINLDYIDLTMSAIDINVENSIVDHFTLKKYRPTIHSKSIDLKKIRKGVKWKISESEKFLEQDADLSLADLTYTICDKLEETLTEAEITSVIEHIVLELRIGTSFYLSIAKIRATRILFQQLTRALGLKKIILPKILVAFDITSWDDDNYGNLITSTTQALSSILGGANTVYIKPAGLSESGKYYRLARNIHQLLALESQIQQWTDPVKGSYYLESLSHKIAKSAWSILQKKMADEG